MNGNLGRDKLWNQQIWSDIDKAVQDEVGRIRVAQKVFPSTVVNNVLPVIANTAALGPGALRAGVDTFRPFLELSREFVLTQAQVDGEENMHLAPTLARLAASAIASAEDTVLFFGQNSIGHIAGTGVSLTNQGALPPGFVAEAAAFAVINVTNVTAANPVGNIIRAVSQSMAALNADAQPGPYALFLPPNRYAAAFAPTAPGTLQTPGDQINRVVTGGFYMLNSLAGAVPAPHDIGILVSLGGEPAKIILGSEAITAFTFTNVQGDYHFRVFERIQLMVKDGRAFRTLRF